MSSSNLKPKHIFLYLIALILLNIANFPGSALLGLFCFFQMSILLFGMSLTKSLQWMMTKVFLFLIPFFVFWGGLTALAQTYFKNSHVLFLLAASSVTLILTYFCVGTVFSMLESLRNHQVSNFKSLELRKTFQSRRLYYFFCSLFVWIFSLIPLTSADWMIVWGLALVQIYFSQKSLKQAFSV